MQYEPDGSFVSNVQFISQKVLIMVNPKVAHTIDQ